MPNQYIHPLKQSLRENQNHMLSYLNAIFRQTRLRLSHNIWQRKLKFAKKLGANDIDDIQRRLRRIALERSKLKTATVDDISTILADQVSLSAPAKTDWYLRPKAWIGLQQGLPITSAPKAQKICQSIMLFHDCPVGDIRIEQVPSITSETTATFDLKIDIGKFEGSYLSIALNLPKEAIFELGPDHIIQANLLVGCDPKMDIYGRLNLQSKSGIQQIVRAFSLTDLEYVVNFELQGHMSRERIIDNSWIDISFDNPQNQTLIMHDLTCFRRKRAAI